MYIILQKYKHHIVEKRKAIYVHRYFVKSIDSKAIYLSSKSVNFTELLFKNFVNSTVHTAHCSVEK